ncbi:MAG: hypothetical protein KatS3mg082_3386 [Nitrospiraceae bacterium]|nr:MAG: hypothetical protein KatS3mg082_3386 [Nitrospiraceae bacterium]
MVMEMSRRRRIAFAFGMPASGDRELRGKAVALTVRGSRSARAGAQAAAEAHAAVEAARNSRERVRTRLHLARARIIERAGSLLSPRTAAKRLGISPHHLVALLRRGRLVGVRCGRSWYLPVDQFAGRRPRRGGKGDFAGSAEGHSALGGPRCPDGAGSGARRARAARPRQRTHAALARSAEVAPALRNRRIRLRRWPREGPTETARARLYRPPSSVAAP